MDYNIYIIFVGVNLLLWFTAAQGEYCYYNNNYNDTMYCSTGCCGFSSQQYCCDDSNKSSMLSIGAIIGISIGIVALFFLLVSFIVAICCCCCICCRRKKEPDGPVFQSTYPAVAVYVSPNTNPGYDLTGNVNGVNSTQFQTVNAQPGSTQTLEASTLMTERTIP